MTSDFICRLTITMISIFFMGISCAGTPLWTFVPLTATKINVPTNSTATIQYQITNQSQKMHTLKLSPIAGITQVTTSSYCGNPFTLAYQESCILTLEINATNVQQQINGGPQVCDQGNPLQCYQPNQANSLAIMVVPAVPVAIISVSGSPITLFTNGSPVNLVVNNNSTDVVATNINSNFTGTVLDGLVSQSGSTCSSVATQSPCLLTFTPNSTIVPQTSFPVMGDNTNTTFADIAVLGIGSPYQGGVIAALDGGMNNLIAAVTDISTAVEWGDAGLIVNAISMSDGDANTSSIVNVLGNNGGTPYAAMLCADYAIDSDGNSPCQTGTCYNDWFLPAVDQLILLYQNSTAIGGFNTTGSYWTSTEFNSGASRAIFFLTGLNFIAQKFFPYQVRCVRVITA